MIDRLPFEIAVRSVMQIGKPNSIDYTRIDVDLLIGFGECEIELAVAMQDEVAIDVGGDKVRVELHSLIEIGNRSIMATLFIAD
jgi:hypothetical protein